MATDTVRRDARDTSRGEGGGASAASSATSTTAVQLKHALGGLGFAEQEAVLAPVQMDGGGDSGQSASDVHALAARGTAGAGGSLPHLDRIQAAFGSHDVSNVQAYSGGSARDASKAMGAAAYASGDKVAFGDAPDLHTAAHEAAHVVQQRGGVSLAGGVGQSGDSYEQHADKVADAVVSGKSAEGLLDGMSGGGAGGGVQRKVVQRDGPGTPPQADAQAPAKPAADAGQQGAAAGQQGAAGQQQGAAGQQQGAAAGQQGADGQAPAPALAEVRTQAIAGA